MTFCKTTHDLNNNMDVLDMDDLKDELIEERSNQFFDALKQGKTIHARGNDYTLDCFVRDTEIDTKIMKEVILGNSLPLEVFMIEALNSWCWELAKEDIK